jgi:hypothetical protein
MLQINQSKLVWTKSSYCESSGCIEVAKLQNGDVLLRDSKQADGPVLQYTPQEWRAFLDGAKDGQFDKYAQEV